MQQWNIKIYINAVYFANLLNSCYTLLVQLLHWFCSAASEKPPRSGCGAGAGTLQGLRLGGPKGCWAGGAPGSHRAGLGPPGAAGRSPCAGRGRLLEGSTEGWHRVGFKMPLDPNSAAVTARPPAPARGLPGSARGVRYGPAGTPVPTPLCKR